MHSKQHDSVHIYTAYLHSHSVCPKVSQCSSMSVVLMHMTLDLLGDEAVVTESVLADDDVVVANLWHPLGVCSHLVQISSM